jgi:hypothetical protein
VIPKPVLQQVRKLVTAYRRLGSFREVRRKVGVRRYHVRNALILAKVLRKHGPVDKTRCPEVPEGSLTNRSASTRVPPSEPAGPLSRLAELATR